MTVLNSNLNDLPVSVVIPTYNRATTIHRAIHSVLNQTHRNIELLVVDDASTDPTCELVSKITDPRLRLLRLENHQGVSNARNTGAQEARADWIAFLDSDDEWLPNKLAAQLCGIREALSPQNTVFYHNYQKPGKAGVAIMPRVPYENGTLMSSYLFTKGGHIHPSTLLLSRSLFLQYQFDISLPIHEDWDMLMRMQDAGVPFSHLNQALTLRHILDDSERLGGIDRLDVSEHFLSERKALFTVKSHWSFQGRVISQKLIAQGRYLEASILLFQSCLRGGISLQDLLKAAYMKVRP